MTDPIPFLGPDDGPDAAEAGAPGEDTMLIVVGAHLVAEVTHRPLAYQLMDYIESWQDLNSPDDGPPPSVSVCTDMWYLNAADLQPCPCISLGGPELNAATAFLAHRLPRAIVIEDTLQIQLDQDYLDLRACLWGVSDPATRSAVELFIDRYLDPFLRAAHRLPEAA